MNVVLECDVILSKKLEAICENGEPISIHITSVYGNKGRAIMRVTCKDNVNENDISKIGETSLMFKVGSVSEDIKTIAGTHRVSNLIGNILPTSYEKVISKIDPDLAQRNIDEGYRRAHQGERPEDRFKDQIESDTERHIVPSQTNYPTANPDDTMKKIMEVLAAAGINVPLGSLNQQKVTSGVPEVDKYIPPKRQTPQPQQPTNCIKTYEELMEELSNIPGIDKEINIPLDRKMTPQEAESLMNRMPKLRKKAFLRNNIQSQLLIADLFTTIDGGGTCLSILPGAVVDLARIPAKNILNCTQLKWCFDTNKVQLVDESAFIASFKSLELELKKWDLEGALNVYSSRDEVGEPAFSGDSGTITVGTDSEHIPPPLYEESQLMSNIVAGMPTSR